MSDIIKRLRTVMRDQFYTEPKASRTCQDAIDEIERLRGALRVFSDPRSWCHDGICDPNSAHFRGQRVATEALALPPKVKS